MKKSKQGGREVEGKIQVVVDRAAVSKVRHGENSVRATVERQGQKS